MNIQEFAEQIKKEILQSVPSIKNITVKQMLKNNSVRYTGLVFETEGSNLSPTIYLDSYYERYQKGQDDIENIKEQLINMYYDACVEESLDVSFMTDWEKAKPMVAYKLINKKMNEERLKNLPYQEVFDLAMIFYLRIEQMNGDVVIQNEHIERWGIQLEDVVAAAKINTPILCPSKFRSMGEVLAELIDTDLQEDCNCMHVLSNERNVNGAGAILYPNMLEKIGTKLKADYYVLPSSIHELIIVPDSDEISETKLVGMVRDVNESSVSHDEILGNNIYFYSRSEKKLQMVG